jgi:cytochrome c oxidase subunit 2
VVVLIRTHLPDYIQCVVVRSRWVGTMLILFSVAMVGVTRPAPVERVGEEVEARVVNVLAERFFFVPSRFRVKLGELVELRIRSADTNHGFRIRKAGINVVIPKRGKGAVRVRFQAGEKGTYVFECSKACGAGHNMMRGTIIVK